MTTNLRTPVNVSFIVGMDEMIVYHTVNLILGAFTTVVNLLLLAVFLASSMLRQKCETLIVLCLADGINGFSIFLMGLNRMSLYSKVIDTLTIPVRTSWECAVEPWLFFRGYGDLWPPIVQFAMGIDRCAAVFNPIVYNKRAFKRRGNFFGATLLCVSCVLAVGYGISWSMRSIKAKYYCGRKAAFGNTFASFVYGMNIVCYITAFLLSSASYIKSKYYLDLSSAKHQLARIRYQLMISVLSIVLISTPNSLSLLSQYITDVADAISRPSTYLICVNSCINIIVYIVLYHEFRNEFLRIILCRAKKTSTVMPITVSSYQPITVSSYQ